MYGVAPLLFAFRHATTRFARDILVIVTANVVVSGNSDRTDFPSTCCAGLLCDRDHLHKIENRSAGELQALDQFVLKFIGFRSVRFALIRGLAGIPYREEP